MAEEPIIRFEEVTIEVRPPFDAGLRSFSCAVRPGELLAVHVADGYGHIPLASAAQGLITPDSGRVFIKGEDWSDVSPMRAAKYRGKIGRVFEEHGWVSNLDMDENITLSERHHTLRPEEEIVAEARELARRFGLPELPAGRAGILKRADRRRAEWVRAFLGSPLLILLEHPMRDVYEEARASLLNEVRAAKERGAGVVWILSDSVSWKAVSEIANCKLKQNGADLVPAEGM